jgi:O-antigen/teichoic acid export membrane protein
MTDQAVVSGASFATVLLLGRFVPQASLGIYHLSIGLFFFLQSLSEQLVHLPYLIRQSRLPDSRIKPLNGSVLVHNTTLAISGAIVILIIGLVVRWTHVENRQMASAMMALAVAVPWLMARDFIHNLLHTRLSQLQALVIDTLVVSLQLSLLVLLAYYDYLQIPLVFLVMGLSTGLVASIWLSSNRSFFEIKSRLIIPQWHHNWIVGRWALGSYLVGSAAPMILPWLLAFTHGLESAGLLAACMTLAGLPQMFLRGTSKYLAPLTANAYGQLGVTALNRVMNKFLLLYVVSMTAVLAVFALYGESLVRFCFDDSYAGTATIMLVLGLTSWLQGPDMVAGSGLNAFSRTDLNFAADLVRCLGIVIGAPLFIPALGALGVPLALLIGMITGGITRVILYRLLSQNDG